MDTIEIVLPPFNKTVQKLISDNNNLLFVKAITHDKNKNYFSEIANVVYKGMVVETINYCLDYEVSNLNEQKVDKLINKVMASAAKEGCIDVMINLFERYEGRFVFNIENLSEKEVLSNPTVIDTILQYVPNLFLDVKYDNFYIPPLVLNCHCKNNCSTFDKLLIHGADPRIVFQGKTLYRHCTEYLSNESLNMIAHLFDLGIVTREDILGDVYRKSYYHTLCIINGRIGQNNKFLRTYLSYFENKVEEIWHIYIEGGMEIEVLRTMII